jgi:orotidine-5'-phosphate decarboxylase
MMTFLEKIKSAQLKTNSKLCIGLDTALSNVPEFLLSESNPVLTFNKAIIDATKDIACAYKPNMAYYEAYGVKGFEALEGTLSHIPDHIFTIADVKRGDLGATSDQYAITYQEKFPFDSITINPYMGKDSVEPFLKRDDRGVFFLGLTSNPSSKEFQYLELASGKKLYEEVTDKVREWNKLKQNCGLVVGATKPSELKALRERAPELPFLIPGIGAQGGSVEEVLAANGNGIALINASRAICGASKGKDFAEAARAAAMKLVEVMR